MTDPVVREHRLAFLTRSEVGERAADAVAVLPLGATEQHGPHLAIGTDHLVVDRVACDAAAALAGRPDVIVAPTIPFGFSAHHMPFGATVSISTQTLMRFLEEACHSLLASGFRRVFILNGHGGNEELVRVVARQVATDAHALVAAGSYWVIAWDRLIAAGVQEVGQLPGHAGAFETSLMRAVLPATAKFRPPVRPADYLVRTRYHSDFHIENPRPWGEGDGFSDDPSAASTKLGMLALTEIVDGVADAFRQLAQQD